MKIRSLAMAGASAALLVASLGVAGAATAAPTGGANADGPYTASDGPSVDSMNGQGKAPWLAGEKGKADDKNPPGQVKKHMTDEENGYECDENRGVGKGNPAHSGCSPQIG